MQANPSHHDFTFRVRHAAATAQRGVFLVFTAIAGKSRAVPRLIVLASSLISWLQVVAFVTQPTVPWSAAMTPLRAAATSTTLDPALAYFGGATSLISAVFASDA